MNIDIDSGVDLKLYVYTQRGIINVVVYTYLL